MNEEKKYSTSKEKTIKYRINSNIFNMVAFGCWGVYCDDGEKIIPKYKKNKLSYETVFRGQKSVRDKLIEYTLKNNISDIYLTGDNIYAESVGKLLSPEQSEEIKKTGGYNMDKQIKQGFVECFLEKLKTKRYFLALGNHDLENCDILGKQLNYNQWKLPSIYYSVKYTLKDFQIKIIVLDTNMFIEKGAQCDNTPFSQEQINSQIEWAKKEIIKDGWNIVIGHNPFLANGHKLKEPIIENERLETLLKELNPHLYICADEHNQQFLETTPPTVIMGTGGTELDSIIHSLPETRFLNKNFGFAGYRIDKNKIEIELVSVNETFFKHTILYS